MTFNIKTPGSVLAVFAHPDDMDFSSAGTMAKWAAQGANITYLVCTDGSKGSDDETMTTDQLIATRRQEQKDAADILGVSGVLFLDHKDGELVCDMPLKEAITRVIRMKKPDVVVTLDPTFVYSTKRGMVNHTDHRAVGEATMDCAFPLARDRLNFPDHERDGLLAHKTKTLMFTSFEDLEHIEDVSGYVEKKWEGIKAHTSQVNERTLERISDRSKELGKRADVEYAEGFKMLELPM